MDALNQWLRQVADTVPGFINSLSDHSQTGRYFPCKKGISRIGQEASLGFSCFALKLYFILKLWDKLKDEKQNEWIEFIKGFQNLSTSINRFDLINAFVDPVLINNAYDYMHYPTQLIYHLSIQLRNPKNIALPKYSRQNLTNPINVVLAETKQAIASLNEIGAIPNYPFQSYPRSKESLNDSLTKLDWHKPWEAGGQAASFAVFIATQQTHLDSNNCTYEELKSAFSDFIESIVDSTSGIYYRGATPDYGQSINGAMKVLTALDWLQIPIHYPQQLIDTCLSHFPSSEGCHLVDTVYVLYRCLQYTKHRKDEIIDYLRTIIDMIKTHYNSDGGFSYHVNRSQTNYYNIRISKGLPESDLHGTLLMIWAITLILEICEKNTFGWRVLKP